MRDLMDRLRAINLGSTGASNTFDEEIVALVESFQRSRGLPITGVVDRTTYDRLGEASWQLGQRLLYLTRPMLRGDDVAELQVLLAQLGFNPGRIDGIFGPATTDALAEFQRNCALDASGALTKATLLALRRVRATNATPSLVTDARDLAGIDPLTNGSVLICGVGPLASGLARHLEGDEAILFALGVSQEEAALYANIHDVALVLSFQTLDNIEGFHLHYWASYRAHSHRGEVLASALASHFAHLPDDPRVEVTGMALPILRETKMTTVHIEHGDVSEAMLHQSITAFEGVVEQVIHRFEQNSARKTAQLDGENPLITGKVE
ncbi:MAG: peptidoglycan-binding domain-containing protein [Acidimicrobiales bacterium]